MDHSDVCSSNDRFTISMQKDNDEKTSSDGLHSKTPRLNLENREYDAKMEELHLQLDMVRKMGRPGCSQEVLDVALTFMASLIKTLSTMSSSQPHLHASL